MTPRDAAIPFVLGVAQFTLIAVIGTGMVHVWFYVLFGTTAFSTWAVWLILVNGRAWRRAVEP